MKYEYKVINTAQEGVPLEGDKTVPYFKRFEYGLDRLGALGWKMCGHVDLNPCDLLIFVREMEEVKAESSQESSQEGKD
jgi:hypothetical protein